MISELCSHCGSQANEVAAGRERWANYRTKSAGGDSCAQYIHQYNIAMYIYI